MKSIIHHGFSRHWLGVGMQFVTAAAQVKATMVTSVVALSFLGAAVCANAQHLNGTLDTAFYGSPLHVQTLNTQFGNSAGGGDATGSELDAVYAKVSGGNLYLFIAGCFQNSGNHFNVFIAGGASGQNTLAAPTTATLKNMNGSVFPAGFQATWAYDGNDSSGTIYSEEYSLTGTPTGGYVGPLGGTSGIFAGSDGGVASLYLNNTLASTMGTASYPLSGANVGASVTTGLEMVIPTSAIGYTGGSVNVLIDINGGSDGYLSNQFLPGLDVLSAGTSAGVKTNNLGSAGFNFGAIPTPTNYVTFVLDLSAQVALGTFTNTDNNPSDANYGLPVNSVAIAADPSTITWNATAQLTNANVLNPADPRTNVYIGTFPVIAFLPDTFGGKFRVNSLDGGYEQPVSTGGNNRSLTLTNQYQTFSFKYDDLSVYDLVLRDTWVTFTLYLTNQTALDPSGAFTKNSSDVPYVNGSWLGWPAWGVFNLPANQALTEVGNSDYYTNSLLVPKGSSIYITYKYSVDGVDNENGSGINHIREIRTYATNYAFPQDVWSWSLPGNGSHSTTPGLTSTNIVEPDFGYLVITGTPHVPVLPITWLGRPGVVLQNVSSLSGGSWNSNAGTDGTQSTNWPNTGSSQFFRLMKKQ